MEGSRRHRIAHTGGGRRISLSVTQGVQFTVLGERPPEALKARFAVLQLYNNLCRLCLPLLVRGPTAMNKWRIVTVGVFGWEIAHEAVSRRPPMSLSRIVARNHMYTYAGNVWDSSTVQGPSPVAPCQTLIVTIRSFCVAGAHQVVAEVARERAQPQRVVRLHTAIKKLRIVRLGFGTS